MKKTLLLAAALMVVTATMASAQRGSLSLGWGNCRLASAAPVGTALQTWTCTTNTGNVGKLVGGFTPSAPLNSLNGGFLYLDIAVDGQASPSLPPWWAFVDPPSTGCRPLTSWSPDFANAGAANCDITYWETVGSPSSAVRYFNPSYGSNHATLRLLVGVDAAVAATTPQIPVGTEGLIFAVNLTRAGTLTPCAGCQTGVCIYFSRADLTQTNQDNFTVGGGPDGAANHPQVGNRFVSGQIAQAAPCADAGTPVRNSTWGGIKSLYR